MASDLKTDEQRPEWKSWATLDDDGCLCTLGELSQKRTDDWLQRHTTEDHIAQMLGEKDRWPLHLIHVIVKQLGVDQARAFLHQTLEVERQGGMMLVDGSRRRTPGGVFFFLVRTTGPEEIKTLGLWRKAAKPKKKVAPADGGVSQPKKRKKEQPENKPQPKAPKQEGPKGTSVKITIIGRPASPVKDKDTCVVFVMQNSKVPSLPKGLPAPAETKTNYVVYVASKQWKNVASALDDPDDLFIVEGYPQLDVKSGSISVFAINATTTSLQKAKRGGA